MAGASQLPRPQLDRTGYDLGTGAAALHRQLDSSPDFGGWQGFSEICLTEWAGSPRLRRRTMPSSRPVIGPVIPPPAPIGSTNPSILGPARRSCSRTTDLDKPKPGHGNGVRPLGAQRSTEG